MPTLELVCPVCGNAFKRRSRGVRDGTYCCSLECRTKLTQKDGRFRCRECGQWLPGEAFPWYDDTRYSKGKRRVAYCRECCKTRCRDYHGLPENKALAKEKHDRWRKENLAAGGDRALRWYFARQMGGYRKRARELGLDINLDPDFLVALFHIQEGKCYYTEALLDWNSYGKKYANSDSLSVDRKNPNLGYLKDNVVLCTYRANTMKGRLMEKDFIILCRTVVTLAERRGSCV